MIEQLIHTLAGEGDARSSFVGTFECAAADFKDLLAFRENSYSHDLVLTHLANERQRLQRLHSIRKRASSWDQRLGTNFDQAFQTISFSLAGRRFMRLAVMRDQGLRANRVMQQRELLAWAWRILKATRTKHTSMLDSFEEFSQGAKSFFRVDDGEILAWLYEYIQEFIEICPKYLLEDGVFGKFMRSAAGVYFYAQGTGKSDHRRKSHLAAYFATSYLFDDIMDAPEYTSAAKEVYYQNVVEILSSGRGETMALSTDPLMAFSEKALVGMRNLLDANEWTIVSRAYIAMAEATLIGARWRFSMSLNEADLYTTAAAKAAYTRLIPSVLGGRPLTERFLKHCIRAGLLNQLNDDFRDLPDDVADSVVTPYTYYNLGINKMEWHPLVIFLSAASRFSDAAAHEIRGAMELWILRLSHSVRILRLKQPELDLHKLLIGYGFPENDILSELVEMGKCRDEIMDIEADAARMYSNAAVRMRGGWDCQPVAGH